MKATVLIIVLAVAGGVYGGISANKNHNPYSVQAEQGMPAEELARVKLGKKWEPSPAWLPAYLLCTVPKRTMTTRGLAQLGISGKEVTVTGRGHENTGGGWMFSSRSKKTQFYIECTVLGAVMGLVLSVLIAVPLGWIKVTATKKSPSN